MATEFNKCFAKIGETLAGKIKQNQQVQFKEEENEQKIHLEPTNLKEITTKIHELKNNAAPGIDKVIKQDILLLIDIIGPTFVRLTNIILETGQYPEELKSAKIIPIYKKGAHDDINNYRPISLLSTISKVLEKIIKTRLVTFIETTFNFDNKQYGFKKKAVPWEQLWI